MSTSLPSAFLPTEDQGYMNTDVQLPPGATLSRTLETTQHLEQYLGTRPAVSDVLTVQGFSFSGQGQNAGLGFVMFKDWAKRDKNESAMAEADQANQNLALVPDGTLFSVVPPSVEGMGNSSGFALRLQDRSGLGREALLSATETLIKKVFENPQIFSYMMVEGLSDAPALDLRIDRNKAEALGVPFDAINSALSTAFGSALINEFPNKGRMQRVIVQAQPESRTTPESVAKLNVRNRAGELVPMESFSEIGWKHAPIQLIRYNGYPSIKLIGDAAAGGSTGVAMKEVERLIGELPRASATNGPACRSRKRPRLAGAHAAGAGAAGGVPGAGRAVRKLEDSRVRAADRAGGRAGRGGGGDRGRHAQRRTSRWAWSPSSAWPPRTRS